MTLLIADFSGRAVVRLTSADARRRRPQPRRGAGRDAAAGGHAVRAGAADPAGRRRRPIDDGARMIVPVTDRGDAIGLLELDLPRHPSAERGRRHRQRRARAGLRRHRRPPAHRRLRVGPALHAVRPGRGDPAPAAAGVLHLRGRAVHPRRLAGAGQLRSAGTPSTTRWTATPCRCRSPTPSATRSRRRCWPPCSSAACATAAARAWTSASRPRYANDCAGRERRRPASSSPVS